MYWYIPGCDVRKNHPEAIADAISWMEKKGIPEGPCCRKDLSMLKNGDTVIVDCTQCSLLFSERTPGIRIQTLYEFLLNDTEYVWKDYAGNRLVLQDCLRMKNDPVIHSAVRSCLEKMNIRITELEHNRDEADFCGVWLNNPPAEDCVRLAPGTFAELEKQRHILTLQEQKEKMETYVSALPGQPVAVYCNGCEKGIRLGGGTPVHMIELLFGK